MAMMAVMSAMDKAMSDTSTMVAVTIKEVMMEVEAAIEFRGSGSDRAGKACRSFEGYTNEISRII